MISTTQLKQWIKQQDTPTKRWLYSSLRSLRAGSVPVIPGLHRALYGLSRALKGGFVGAVRVFWTTPVFRSQLTHSGKGLYLFGGMPLLLGPLDFSIGNDVRLSGHTTMTGRSSSKSRPLLKVGDNVDIGWQCTIAVGSRVIIEDNVRLSERCFLAGYPGHPLDPADRAAGLPDTDDQVGDIVIKNGAWLCFGTVVLAGVTIGEGSVVGAGSVVTKDIPAGVLAAGNPARILRRIETAAEPLYDRTS
ncbi:acyltransferase [Pseudovibrio exalbescens]|uniref:acyltransferase n=1 Tax=Pseudovibrio exalbescens TaxID=197461 RepID=UPI0003F8B92B|nr:acyltransferase [Pseudovibrio exalbescens]